MSAVVVGSAAVLLWAAPSAYAQDTRAKLSNDLQQVMAAAKTPKLNWVKDLNGLRYVKALIVAESTDPELMSLRSAVVKSGGSVYMRFVSVRAQSVMVPTSAVATLAQRSDMQSISANRLASRSASVLEATSESGQINPTNPDNTSLLGEP